MYTMSEREKVARAMCEAYGIDPEASSLGTDGKMRRAWEARLKEADAAISAMKVERSYMSRVRDWMIACFGPKITADGLERNHRFFEEATELVQALDMPRKDAHDLVEYVYNRAIGEAGQEVGGVMVTLAALCGAFQIDLNHEAEKELTRVWTKVDVIRAKQAAKPKFSALPQAVE